MIPLWTELITSRTRKKGRRQSSVFGLMCRGGGGNRCHPQPCKVCQIDAFLSNKIVYYTKESLLCVFFLPTAQPPLDLCGSSKKQTNKREKKNPNKQTKMEWNRFCYSRSIRAYDFVFCAVFKAAKAALRPRWTWKGLHTVNASPFTIPVVRKIQAWNLNSLEVHWTPLAIKGQQK